MQLTAAKSSNKSTNLNILNIVIIMINNMPKNHQVMAYSMLVIVNKSQYTKYSY